MNKNELNTRRFLAVLTALALLSGLFGGGFLPGYAAETDGFAGGDGSSGNPYLIKTAVQLDRIRQFTGASNKSVCFRLENDIDLTEYISGGQPGYHDGKGWEPIGKPGALFQGKLDGNGHEISGLWINRPEESKIGLFGYLDGGVSALGVRTDDEKGGVVGKNETGILCGIREGGTLEHCYAVGRISGGEMVGGLVGSTANSTPPIQNCFAQCEVEGSYYVGGLIGKALNRAQISNCYATGKVSCSGSNCGGLIGRLYGTVTNCYAACAIKIGTATGGFAGSFDSESSAENCFFDTEVAGTVTGVLGGVGVSGKTTAELTAADMAGTLGGAFVSNTITGFPRYPELSYFSAHSSSKFREASTAAAWSRLADFADGDGTSESPYRIKTAEQLDKMRNYTGVLNRGVCFRLEKDIDLTKFLSQGQPGYHEGKGWEPIGKSDSPFNGNLDGNGHEISGLWSDRPEESRIGLFGYAEGMKASGLGVRTDDGKGGVAGNDYIGILLGYGDNVRIENCYAIGKSAGANYVGGLSGYISWSVKNCFARCEVTGSDNTGGLFGGMVNNTQMSNCYAAGRVTCAGTNVGGLTGVLYGTAENCYAAVDMTGSTQAGGLLGSFDSSSPAVNCFFDTEAAGTEKGVADGNSAGVTGKTTAELTAAGMARTLGGAFLSNTITGFPRYPELSYFAEHSNSKFCEASAAAAYSPEQPPPVELFTDVLIDLTSKNVDIVAGSKAGRVRIKRGNDYSADYDPAVTRFIVTTKGKPAAYSFGIANAVTQDLTLTLRDCRIRLDNPIDASAYNDYGTSGRVKLTLEGSNEIWSGDHRPGVRIRPGRIYEVHGPGVLSVKGGAPLGVYNNDGYETAGTLELHSGTILTEGSSKSNASIVYFGGSLLATFQDNAPVKNSGGTTLYPVTADFSDASVQPLLSSAGTISVNGTVLTLDARKNAYLYLAAGVSQITFGSVGGSASALPIDPVTTGNNPKILVTTPENSLFVTAEADVASAVLTGRWGSGFTGARGFAYRLRGSVGAQIERIVEKDQTSLEITGLTPGQGYECCSWGADASGIKRSSDWIAFQTTPAFTVEVTGGSVTNGTPVFDRVYLSGSEITVTADGIPGTFLGWFEDSELVSSDVEYTFVLDKNRNLEAKFLPYADLLTIDREEGDILTASFESSGDLPWQVVAPDEPELPYLRSGGITHSQSSTLTLTVDTNVPKYLVFDWKVSSEERFDLFTYSVDEEHQATISGQTQWEAKSLLLHEGQNIITWTYSKDHTGDAPGDYGYLKNLRLGYGMRTLTVTGGAVTEGTAETDGKYLFGAEITVTANEQSGQFFNGWYDEKGNLVSADDVYAFVITEDQDLTARYVPVAGFFNIENSPGVTSAVFEHGGDRPWKPEPGGSPCLSSGKIQDSEMSNLNLTLNLSQAQQLTFNWRVSSEKGYDKLKLLLDWNELAVISGEEDWLSDQDPMTVLIPRGEHTITWRYEKDGSSSSNLDRGYLKDLLLTPVGEEVEVSAQPNNSLYGSVSPESGLFPVGGDAIFTALPAKGYYLQYWQDAEGNRVSDQPTLTVPAEAATYTAVFGVLNQNYSPLIAAESETLTLEPWGSFWTMQPDGSARSGPLVEGEYERSVLRTAVMVPMGQKKTLLFDWKVSAPAAERLLSLYVDGEEYTSISGAGDGWQNYGLVLPEGKHTIEWVYEKVPGSALASEQTEDVQLSAERPENCGWVKNICLKMPGLYSVTLAGDATRGSVEVGWSSKPAAGGKYYEGTQVVLEAYPSDGYYCKGWMDSAGNMVSTMGYFDFTVTGDAEYTAVFEQVSAYLNIVSEDNRDNFTFLTAYDSAWTVNAGEARSGDAKYDSSSLKAEVRINEPSLLTFEWKVSCDAYAKADQLSFRLNNDVQASMCGVYGGWARYAIVLSEGTHTLEWVFNGYGPYPDGENCGWVRNISLSAQGQGRITVGTAENGSGSTYVPEEIWPLTDGEPVLLTAAPDPGYACVGWKDETGETVSDLPNFTAYVCGDMTYIPVFEEESAVYDEASGRAVITLGQEYASPAVVLAAYDSRGIMTSHAVMDSEMLLPGRSRIPAPAEFQPKDGDTVKVLVWDDLNSMKPLLGNPEP